MLRVMYFEKLAQSQNRANQKRFSDADLAIYVETFSSTSDIFRGFQT